MKKTSKILLCTIIMVALLSICYCVEAASANISASKTTATVGESVTLTVKYTAAAWNLTVSGDGISQTKYVGNTDDAKNATTTKTITLNTSSAGTKTIKLTGDVSDVETDVTTKINTSIKITVNPKSSSGGGSTGGGNSSGGASTPTKATMTKVKVGSTNYTKNLSKGITVKVNNDVTSIKITPTISNGESYTINGGKSNTVKLEEGTNTVTIKLASGNTYKVYVQRLAKEDNTPNIIDEEIKVLLKSLKVEGFTLDPEFSSEVYEYKLAIGEEHDDIEKLNIEAIGTQEDFTVEITGNENLVEGENTITVIVKSKDGTKTATYKIIVTKQEKAVVTSVEPLSEGQQEISITPNWTNTEKILITIFTSIITIMGIGYAVIEYRYRKDKEENEMGEIPYSKIGFENDETEKQDILKDEKQEDFEEPKKEKKGRRTKEKIVEEENEKDEKPKKGKHF